MIEDLRNKFNAEFNEEKYGNLLNEIWSHTNGEKDFRICETPLFLSDEFNNKLIAACDSIISQIQNKDFVLKSENAVPEKYNIPNEDKHPLFLQVDFAVAKNNSGDLVPQLIELQGFPSLYTFQKFLAERLRSNFEIPEKMTTYYSGIEGESYSKLMSEALLNGKNNENVVLLEINPDKQKTRIDFYLTKKYFGIEPICITEVIQKGNKLFYKKGNSEVPIERIYNRVIFDELENKNIEYNFNIKDDLNVEWAGHPNWFFRISKYSLPLIKSEYAPICFFLNKDKPYPPDLENFVLKPLYSFAGSGVVIDVNPKTLDEIHDPQNYILQRKVEYAPIIKTPDADAKVEIRMMFVWIDKPVLVNNLVRISKGKMMGVDYNKNQTWIGASIAFHN